MSSMQDGTRAPASPLGVATGSLAVWIAVGAAVGLALGIGTGNRR
jgi:hypothetical protein